MSDANSISDNDRTTGMGLWTDSKEMLAAATYLLADDRLCTSSPIYYLAGHGIEVGFKAFLRACGQSLNELRNIGHNLEHALRAAESAGFESLCALTPQDRALIGILNVYYKAKHFEYRVTGSMTLPQAKDVIDLGTRMLNSTKSTCELSIGLIRT